MFGLYSSLGSGRLLRLASLLRVISCVFIAFVGLLAFHRFSKVNKSVIAGMVAGLLAPSSGAHAWERRREEQRGLVDDSIFIGCFMAYFLSLQLHSLQRYFGLALYKTM